jgi:hypothetical protein
MPADAVDRDGEQDRARDQTGDRKSGERTPQAG